MALSESCKNALNQAEASLRNALAFAARQERPMVCGGIADIMQRLDHVMTMDDMLDKFEKNPNNDINFLFLVR